MKTTWFSSQKDNQKQVRLKKLKRIHCVIRASRGWPRRKTKQMKKATLFVPPEKEGGFDQLLSKDWKDRRHDPFETWPCLFIDDMFDNLEEQTQLYATRDKRNDNFYQIRSNVYQFIGILIISGYHSVPKERNYCPSQIYIHVSLIANVRTLSFGIIP